MPDVTVDQLLEEMLRLSRLIDRGVSALAQAGRDLATSEHDYRKAVSESWARAPEGTVPEREAWVKGDCASLRLERDLAEAERVAALEAVRSRRTQLSALQTVANAVRAEAEMAKYGPEVAV